MAKNIGSELNNISGQNITGTGFIPENLSGLVVSQEYQNSGRANQPGSFVNPINASNMGAYNKPTVISGKVWSAFNSDDIVPNVKQLVTEAIWSSGTGSLKEFYLNNTQTSSYGEYYYNVYSTNPSTDTNAEVQFAIAYGHIYGSGSTESENNPGVVGLTPSRAIYSQYRNILLDPTDDSFTLYGGKTVSSAIFITFNRERFKERVDPGNWQICLSGSNGSMTKLIDNYVPTSADTYSSAGSIYDIVSGSLTDGIYNSTSPVYVGKIYPDLGIMMVDGDYLTASASITMNTGSDVAAYNHGKVLTAISGAAVLSTPTVDYGFQARNQQEITSTYYFVRVKNGEYNFSNNVTFTTGSLGDLRHTEMYGDPRVYVTTIGLYDNANQLLAVAKLSKPLQKCFSNELLIRTKIDF